jgi:hypothetical protein
MPNLQHDSQILDPVLHNALHPKWIIWMVADTVVSIWPNLREAPQDQALFLARMSRNPLVVYEAERIRGCPAVGDRVTDPAALGWSEIERHPPGQGSGHPLRPLRA